MGKLTDKGLKFQRLYPVPFTPAHLNSYPFTWFLLLAVTLCFPSSLQNVGGGGFVIKPKKLKKCLGAHLCRFPLSSFSFSLFVEKKQRQKNLAPAACYPDPSGFLKCCEPWESRHSCLPPLFIKAAVAVSSRGRLLVQWVGVLNNTRTTAGAACQVPACLTQSVLACYLALAHLLQNS